MHTIPLDENIASWLHRLEEATALAADGETVGYFVPAKLYEHLLYCWTLAQVSESELETARLEPGGRPLSELLAELTTN